MKAINLANIAPLGILSASVLWLAAGCGTPKQAPSQTAIFFPPPPETPRLQFLTSFSQESDLRGGKDAFTTFVVGKAPPKKPILKPYGAAIGGGKIYVCDTILGALEILDLRKMQLSYFTPQGEGRMRTPINVAVDKDGTRYVADTTRRQILIYGPDGSYRSAMSETLTNAAPEAGATNATPEWKPTDVLVTDDRLLVADLKGQVVRVYNKSDRRPLFTIPQGEITASNRLFQPTNLATDSQGRIYVSDTAGFRVQQFDAQGKYLRTFGQKGTAPGSFALPKGIAVDREGRLYVVDAVTQVAQIFDPEGNLLLYFGEPEKTAAGLNLPAKITIDYEHVSYFEQYAAPGFKLEYLVLITNQYGDRKVSIYGFGRKS